MKVLKFIVLGLFVLVGVLLLVGLMMPQGWSVERSLVVNAEPAKIHPLVGNLESWPRWMPWMEDDPAMKITFDGTGGQPGSTMTWKSETMGNGVLLVLKSDAASGLEYEQRMEEFVEPARGSIRYEPQGTATKVVWSDTGKFGKNPALRLIGPLMETMLGNYFEKGLKNVKSIVEGNA